MRVFREVFILTAWREGSESRRPHIRLGLGGRGGRFGMGSAAAMRSSSSVTAAGRTGSVSVGRYTRRERCDFQRQQRQRRQEQAARLLRPEVASSGSAPTRGGRSRSDTGTSRRCTSGGRGAPWRHVTRSFARRSGPTRTTRFAPRVFEMPVRNGSPTSRSRSSSRPHSATRSRPSRSRVRGQRFALFRGCSVSMRSPPNQRLFRPGRPRTAATSDDHLKAICAPADHEAE